MSGELRLEGSGIGKLVASLAALTESASPAEFAVIGGLAVLARLEGAPTISIQWPPNTVTSRPS